jgi:hypothetical protein
MEKFRFIFLAVGMFESVFDCIDFTRIYGAYYTFYLVFQILAIITQTGPIVPRRDK